MAASRDPKRPKPVALSPPSGHKHLPDAYVPRVVTVVAILGLVHTGAGPDRHTGAGPDGHTGAGLDGHTGAGPDIVVAWIAARQLGLITAEQLIAAGVGRGSIRWRLANGALHRVFRGVYLVGHAVPVPGAFEFAAVLACGAGAVVSHRSAVGVWRLGPPLRGEVEVTVAGRDCRSRAGLRVYQVQELPSFDRATKNGIPVTSAARTLIDYASTTGANEAERAIAEAFALKLVNEPQLLAAIDRGPHRAGVAAVRAILGQTGGAKRTRSGGERAMLRLIRAAGLPEPRTNYPVAGFNADFCWPEERLIVEVDGHDFHSDRRTIERDHRRDVVHKDAGYEVIRFTGRQRDDKPLYVAAVIARAHDRLSRGRG
jgi:very-short-patch-repair endonuclease